MATTAPLTRAPTARITLLGLVALAAIVGCTDSVTAPPPSAAPPRAASAGAKPVTMTELGFTGAATAIAPNGLVAGTEYVGTVTHAVRWDDGVLTDLGTAGGQSSAATGISVHGQVVGSRTAWDGTKTAVLWEDESATLLPPLPGGGYSSANAISPTGDIVVGESDDSDHDSYHAVLWHHGEVVDLGTMGAVLGEGSRAFGVNVRGQVVGLSSVSTSYYDHAFLWYHGAMTDLGTLGRTWSVARAINAVGQVVGHSALGPTRLHSFLWEDGTMTDLGTLGGTSNYAYDINARGQIVGSTQTAEYRSHAYLWYRDVMTDLDAPDGAFSAAYAINDAGQIVGSAWSTGSGSLRAVLWTVR